MCVAPQFHERSKVRSSSSKKNEPMLDSAEPLILGILQENSSSDLPRFWSSCRVLLLIRRRPIEKSILKWSGTSTSYGQSTKARTGCKISLESPWLLGNRTHLWFCSKMLRLAPGFSGTQVSVFESFVDLLEEDGKTGEKITELILEKLKKDGLDMAAVGKIRLDFQFAPLGSAVVYRTERTSNENNQGLRLNTETEIRGTESLVPPIGQPLHFIYIASVSKRVVEQGLLSTVSWPIALFVSFPMEPTSTF